MSTRILSHAFNPEHNTALGVGIIRAELAAAREILEDPALVERFQTIVVAVYDAELASATADGAVVDEQERAALLCTTTGFVLKWLADQRPVN